MRILFATDIHGSDRCWLKFLSAPTNYGCDTIIIGGDITGKFMVPIIANGDGTSSSEFLGIKRKLHSRAEIKSLTSQIANAGQYALETTREEYEALHADAALVDARFKQLVLERVEQWVAIADDKLAGRDIRCFVSGANDDYFEVDDVLRTSRSMEVPNEAVVNLPGFEMLSVGYSNLTPWNCPRDIPEPDLKAKIVDLASRVKDMKRAIFNVHVPPFDTEIDKAPKLDADLRVTAGAFGQPEMVPVGSTAVRECLLEYQPLLGLHGHIHESPGIRRLGSTTIVNPGSEYAEGLLSAAIINLSPEKGIEDIRLVVG